MSKILSAFLALILVFFGESAIPNEVIWICGKVFTDDVKVALRARCQPLENNRLNIVAPPLSAPLRLPIGEQRARDTAARSILEAELYQAEQRYAKLSRSSNNTPDEQAAIMRARGDIASLRREIERVAR